jgi:hypothetical protein
MMISAEDKEELSRLLKDRVIKTKDFPPLIPELQKHLVKDELRQMIHHPLLVTFHHEQDNAYHNKLIDVRKKMLGQHVANENIGSYLAMHERPYRLEALIEALHSWWNPANEKDYWDQVGWVYTDTEFLYHSMDQWKYLLFGGAGYLNNNLMMDDAEKEKYDSLPEYFTVYRGATDPDGYSWTLDEDKARWFASRWGKSLKVFSKKVNKLEDTIAYFSSRNEEEILLNENHRYVNYEVEENDDE